MANPFLIVVAVILSVAILIGSFYILVYFQHPEDKNVAWGPKIVVVCFPSSISFLHAGEGEEREDEVKRGWKDGESWRMEAKEKGQHTFNIKPLIHLITVLLLLLCARQCRRRCLGTSSTPRCIPLTRLLVSRCS